MKFPEDFEKRPHPIGNGTQFCYPSAENCQIRIVLGNMFYSNGYDTYEMFDFREDEPQGYLSVENINEHLVNNPLR